MAAENFDVAEVLDFLVPLARFSIDGNDLSTLVWHDQRSRPSDHQIREGAIQFERIESQNRLIAVARTNTLRLICSIEHPTKPGDSIGDMTDDYLETRLDAVMEWANLSMIYRNADPTMRRTIEKAEAKVQAYRARYRQIKEQIKGGTLTTEEQINDPNLWVISDAA